MEKDSKRINRKIRIAARSLELEFDCLRDTMSNAALEAERFGGRLRSMTLMKHLRRELRRKLLGPKSRGRRINGRIQKRTR